MFRRLLIWQRQHMWSDRAARRGSFGLQALLWLVWSLMLVFVGYLSWHADIAAHRAINTLGMVIHCAVAGLIGLVVMTWLEMRIEPWRFLDKDE